MGTRNDTKLSDVPCDVGAAKKTLRTKRKGETTVCIRLEFGAAALAGASALDAEACEALAERSVAEAMDCGLLGVVEESLPALASQPSEKPYKVLLLYLPVSQASALREAVLSVVGTHALVGEPEVVEDQDWSSYWSRDFAPIEISPRLVICPSFIECSQKSGQAQLTIDPGQAFGTGRHESTFLALQALDSLHATLGPRTTVLDVGTGSGVLALAALLLGAGSATGFDIDPLSPEAALENAQKNGLAERFEVFAGTHAALAPGIRYKIVLANMLRSETEPLLSFIAERTALDGCTVFSGLLASERERFARSLEAVGLMVEREFLRADADGTEWIALIAIPAVA